MRNKGGVVQGWRQISDGSGVMTWWGLELRTKGLIITMTTVRATLEARVLTRPPSNTDHMNSWESGSPGLPGPTHEPSTDPAWALRLTLGLEAGGWG